MGIWQHSAYTIRASAFCICALYSNLLDPAESRSAAIDLHIERLIRPVNDATCPFPADAMLLLCYGSRANGAVNFVGQAETGCIVLTRLPAAEFVCGCAAVALLQSGTTSGSPQMRDAC